MSIRSIREVVEHVHVRGTSVSTSMVAPSQFHVAVVERFGLPNRHGIISCDGYQLYMRFDNTNDNLVHVWAQKNEDREDGWYSMCNVS